MSSKVLNFIWSSIELTWHHFSSIVWTSFFLRWRFTVTSLRQQKTCWFMGYATEMSALPLCGFFWKIRLRYDFELTECVDLNLTLFLFSFSEYSLKTKNNCSHYKSLRHWNIKRNILMRIGKFVQIFALEPDNLNYLSPFLLLRSVMANSRIFVVMESFN